MIIKTFVEGPISANNYLVIDEKTKDAVLIDCSSERKGFIDEIKRLEVNLKYILLTHGHFDHILGLAEFVRTFNVPVYVGQEDEIQIKNSAQMAYQFGRVEVPAVQAPLNFINDGDEFKIGDIVLKAISTPGHTAGGMCYLSNNGKLFSGDTLFQGSVGRCDLPQGDWNALLHSVKDKLFALPDDTEVFTGHGPNTTIGQEKIYNEII